MLAIEKNYYTSFLSQSVSIIKLNPESTCNQWFTLIKPRILALVVFTGTCGIIIAPTHLNLFLEFLSILCICVASGACGAINMWFDRDIDAIMRRTCSRPIPAGQIQPNQVLAFGIILAAVSIILMSLALNILAAAILTLSISFYLVIYTSWLKRDTCQNIVIGGAAGAFPPLIGWASVTGNISFLPLLMFAIIFIWTPSHFWCLALWTKDDYERADIPMLPVTSGELYTRKNIIFYTFLLVIISEVPFFLGLAGTFYALIAGILGLKYLLLVQKVFSDRQDNEGRSLSGDAPAKMTFRYSIWYLFLLFGFMTIDHLMR